MKLFRPCLRWFLLLVFPFLFPSPASAVSYSRQAMVATANSKATQAALQVLEEGGNAVDAAIAAQWVLNVVEPSGSGLGGGGFFVYYDSDSRRVYAFDGREKAPAKASPDMFLDASGKPYEFWPNRISGGLPVGVPGTLKLLETVHKRFGSDHFSFGALFAPAIKLADEGFVISDQLARYLESEAPRLALFPDSRRIYFDTEGKPLSAGAILKQPDLAATFREIAREGPHVFYDGEIAEDIVKAVTTAPFHSGRMTRQDLRTYEIKEREALRGTYRGYEIWSMPPPSSGGSTVLEALKIFEAFSLGSLSLEQRMSIFGQAQGLAFQDRNRYLGDPDVVSIPLERLLSEQNTNRQAAKIARDPTQPAPRLGAGPVAEGVHTSHLSIVDNRGNMVAFTTTIEHMFGSGIVVPGRGFFLNNELTDFDAEPRDEKGRLTANAPGPGKRPRSSMSPVLVFKEGVPVLAVGSPGGSKIIGAVLNVLVNLLDYNLPLEQALAAPRMINRDGAFELEDGLMANRELVRYLQRQGFEVKRSSVIGNVQAVLIRKGTLLGASDPRGEGQAAGL